MFSGSVVSLHIAAAAAAPMQSPLEVRAVPGRGLEGDRYFEQVGTYSHRTGRDRQLTLIEVETLEALKRDHDLSLAAHETRRNIVTRGVPLNHLVGREFLVGVVVVFGVRLNEPCAHLEQLTRPGVLAGLVHRSGLNAEVRGGGVIRVGDTVAEVAIP
jgi:MOSC domain-containing protein YiiM